MRGSGEVQDGDMVASTPEPPGRRGVPTPDGGSCGVPRRRRAPPGVGSWVTAAATVDPLPVERRGVGRGDLGLPPGGAGRGGVRERQGGGSRATRVEKGDGRWFRERAGGGATRREVRRNFQEREGVVAAAAGAGGGDVRRGATSGVGRPRVGRREAGRQFRARERGWSRRKGVVLVAGDGHGGMGGGAVRGEARGRERAPSEAAARVVAGIAAVCRQHRGEL